MVKPVQADKIPITSSGQLENEVGLVQAMLNLAETEHTWEMIDRALKRFHAVIRGGVCTSTYTVDLIKHLKSKQFTTGLIRSVESRCLSPAWISMRCA